MISISIAPTRKEHQSTMNQYSSDTVALLVEKLFVLRNATFQHHAEEAVETLLDVVDQHASDGAFMELVMSLKTMLQNVLLLVCISFM